MPPPKVPDEVVEQMMYLRYVEHKTLQEIADMQDPPISRERVRQLIGNTGQVTRIHRRELAFREGVSK